MLNEEERIIEIFSFSYINYFLIVYYCLQNTDTSEVLRERISTIDSFLEIDGRGVEELKLGL